MKTNSNIFTATESMEGHGAKVKRLFPVRSDRMNYDPFVLWDHFEIAPGAGFPEHPHRGFEAITYLFNGSIEHTDNLNNQSTVYAGGAQRFTAGKGIVHSEMPAKNKISTGIQLWINLPKKLKQIEPAYQQVDANNLSEKTNEGVCIRTIVGNKNGINLHTPVQYLEVRFDQDTQHTFQIPTNHRGFMYVVEGNVMVDDTQVQPGEAYVFEDTETLNVTGNKFSHMMLISGTPHNEPIYQHGTFVD